MGECRFRPPKLAKKKKSVWPALFRGNVCIWSDKISTNVSAILGRKCTARLKVNQNTRSSPLSENLNLEKEWAFPTRLQTREKALGTRLTGSPSSKYVVYATACVYRELYEKITDRKELSPHFPNIGTQSVQELFFCDSIRRTVYRSDLVKFFWLRCTARKKLGIYDVHTMLHR